MANFNFSFSESATNIVFGALQAHAQEVQRTIADFQAQANAQLQPPAQTPVPPIEPPVSSEPA